LVCASACAQLLDAEFDDLLPLEDAGAENDARATAGAGGDSSDDASATAGTSNADAAAGTAGNGGRGGNAGTLGTGGSAATAGTAGTAGIGGTAGVAGSGGDGGPSCQIPSGPGRGDPNLVVINEVYAEGSVLSDYIELLNTNSESVDISRLKVGDEACTADALVFPSETFVAPGGYIVVRGNQAAVSGPMCCPALFGAGTAAVCFTATFGIGADGETVSLCSADNIRVDEVVYPGVLDNTQSYSRFAPADAGADFRPSTPTPGSANR
jgi:hypothetical protein